MTKNDVSWLHKTAYELKLVYLTNVNGEYARRNEGWRVSFRRTKLCIEIKSLVNFMKHWSRKFDELPTPHSLDIR